ncbi:unnamed protein product, partial [Polarella glacialis]
MGAWGQPEPDLASLDACVQKCSESVPPWELSRWVLECPLVSPLGEEQISLNPGLNVSLALAEKIEARA